MGNDNSVNFLLLQTAKKLYLNVIITGGIFQGIFAIAIFKNMVIVHTTIWHTLTADLGWADTKRHNTQLMQSMSQPWLGWSGLAAMLANIIIFEF